MLKKKLIIKLKKKFNFNIGKCKSILEKNDWDYEKSIIFIKKTNLEKKSKNFSFNLIITIEKIEKIYILNIFHNSSIINNSTIIEKFKKSINNLKNLFSIKEKIKIFSIELNEIFFLKNFFIFKKKKIFFYNHKDLFFCIVKYKKNILNICCDLIFNKFNFIKYDFCKNNIKNKKYLKKDVLIKEIINFDLIDYIFLLNKKNTYFFYE